MRRFPLCVFLLVALFLGCEQREDPIAVKNAIMEKNRNFAEAFKRKDISAAMEEYWNSPNLVFMPPDEELIRGYDAVKSSFQKMVQTSETVDFELLDDNVNVVGDMASNWGRWRWTFRTPDGQQISINGRYTTVWEKKNGNWVITVDHASVPMPPSPPAGADTTKKM